MCLCNVFFVVVVVVVFSYRVSWVGCGVKLCQFLRVFLFTFSVTYYIEL